MAAVEQQQPFLEQRSSVAVKMSAKGEAQVEVKVYDGADENAMQALRELAVGTYLAAVRAVRGNGGAS